MDDWTVIFLRVDAERCLNTDNGAPRTSNCGITESHCAQIVPWTNRGITEPPAALSWRRVFALLAVLLAQGYSDSAFAVSAAQGHSFCAVCTCIRLCRRKDSGAVHRFSAVSAVQGHFSRGRWTVDGHPFGVDDHPPMPTGGRWTVIFFRDRSPSRANWWTVDGHLF